MRWYLDVTPEAPLGDASRSQGGLQMMATSAVVVPVCYHTPVPPIINPDSRE
jgi:hypothetical protein